MKELRIIPIGLLLILGIFTACRQQKTFTVSNPNDEDIIDLATVVTRSEINRHMPDSMLNSWVVARDENGEYLPSQCDDFDGDGRWDELIFLSDLEAGETKRITFEAVAAMPDFVVRTNIRFGRVTRPFEEVTTDLRMKTNDTKYTAPVYQMEGPAWENDLIAFRNYYDARNGIDIFGKRTSDLVMDSVGLNGRDYHTLADWGMDVLKVGNSLGAGAIAIGIGDSLYRIGPCEEGTYSLITEGPVRAILELNYRNVPAANRLYTVKHRIAIYAGDRFYRSTVWISGLQGDEELVTGIVDLHNVPADTLSQGSMKILYSLGKQGISGEALGMGVIVPADQLKRTWESPSDGSGIVSTHLISLIPDKDMPASFSFLATWEMQDEKVKEIDHFTGILRSAAQKIEQEK